MREREREERGEMGERARGGRERKTEGVTKREIFYLNQNQQNLWISKVSLDNLD